MRDNPYLDATAGATLARTTVRLADHEAIVDRIGVQEAYQPHGTREVNAFALYHELDEPASARALPGVWLADGIEARAVDPATGADVVRGEEGELWLRGRLVTKPDETARAFTEDGWFTTGDLALRDDTGRTTLRSRLREVRTPGPHGDKAQRAKLRETFLADAPRVP